MLLKKSGYDQQLTHQKSINNKNEETKQYKRKIIWFNTPCSKNVLIKVENQFQRLINKHFFGTTNFTSCSIQTTLK